ncbi:HutD/Ves family protein [Phyllobacterium sp. K27]
MRKQPLTRVIRYADHVEMSWKNGAGDTREIARKDDCDGLLWRLSLATVAESGPFSVFPELDRIIVLLEGDPMTLEFEDGESLTLNLGMPQRFSCNRPLHAQLSSSRQCRDLNFLFRKDDIDARAESITFSGSMQLRWTGAAVAICFAVSGSVLVSADGENADIINEGDTLIFNSPVQAEELSLSLEALSPDAQVMLFLAAAPQRSGFG